MSSISCDCKRRLNRITKVNVSVKNIGRAKKITVGILEHVFLRIVGT